MRSLRAPPPRLQAPHPEGFTEDCRPKPDTTFGNVKADVLAHFVPGFERADFVRIIQASPWPD